MSSSSEFEWDSDWEGKWEERLYLIPRRRQYIWQTDDRIYLKKILPLSCLVLMWFAWFCTILCFHSDDPLCNSVNKSNNRRHLKRAPESRPAAPKKRDHQAGKHTASSLESRILISELHKPPPRADTDLIVSHVSLAGQTWPPLPALSDV